MPGREGLGRDLRYHMKHTPEARGPASDAWRTHACYATLNLLASHLGYPPSPLGMFQEPAQHTTIINVTASEGLLATKLRHAGGTSGVFFVLGLNSAVCKAVNHTQS